MPNFNHANLGPRHRAFSWPGTFDKRGKYFFLLKDVEKLTIRNCRKSLLQPIAQTKWRCRELKSRANK